MVFKIAFEEPITNPYLVIRDSGATVNGIFIQGGICVIHREWLNQQEGTTFYPYKCEIRDDDNNEEDISESNEFHRKALLGPFMPYVPLQGEDLALFKKIIWVTSPVEKIYSQWRKVANAVKEATKIENASEKSFSIHGSKNENEGVESVSPVRETSGSYNEHVIVSTTAVSESSEHVIVPTTAVSESSALILPSSLPPSEKIVHPSLPLPSEVILPSSLSHSSAIASEEASFIVQHLEKKMIFLITKLRRSNNARFNEIKKLIEGIAVQPVSPVLSTQLSSTMSPVVTPQNSPLKSTTILRSPTSPHTKSIRQRGHLKLPLKSVKEWFDFEESLNNDQVFRHVFKMYLHTLGRYGKKPNAELRYSPFVSSVMEQLSKKEVACQHCNLTGAEDKFKLKDSELYKMIYAYTLSRHSKGFPVAVFDARLRAYLHSGFERRSFLTKKAAERVFVS